MDDCFRISGIINTGLVVRKLMQQRYVVWRKWAYIRIVCFLVFERSWTNRLKIYTSCIEIKLLRVLKINGSASILSYNAKVYSHDPVFSHWKLSFFSIKLYAYTHVWVYSYQYCIKRHTDRYPVEPLPTFIPASFPHWRVSLQESEKCFRRDFCHVFTIKKLRLFYWIRMEWTYIKHLK